MTTPEAEKTTPSVRLTEEEMEFDMESGEPLTAPLDNARARDASFESDDDVRAVTSLGGEDARLAVQDRRYLIGLVDDLLAERREREAKLARVRALGSSYLRTAGELCKGRSNQVDRHTASVIERLVGELREALADPPRTAGGTSDA